MTLPPDTLNKALQRHGISLPVDQVQQLDRYCQLLWEINRGLNLTRHTDYDKFVGRDVLDSVQLREHIEPDQSVLDIGTGGGVPGVILAISGASHNVELCESIGKKATAVQSIVRELALPVPVHHARAEQLLRTHHYDVLVARAVGSMSKILQSLRGHWANVGKLLLVKGPNWVQERHDARSRGLLNGLQLRRLATYTIPSTNAEGVILGVWPIRA